MGVLMKTELRGSANENRAGRGVLMRTERGEGSVKEKRAVRRPDLH